MNTIKIDRNHTRIIAHRGLSGIEPENTNFAFVAAGNRSYFGVETDIHCSADGNFILTHDDNTMRVAGESLIVEETDFSKLRALRLFDKDGTHTRTDIHMPTLEEYIRICKKYEKECVLELKNEMTEENVRCIIDRIDAERYLEHVIFISFSFENLVYVRNYKHTQTVQYLFSRMSEGLIDRVRAYGFDVAVYHRVLNEDLIKAFHDAGILVNGWIVDDPAEAERLITCGVDFISTNILE